MCAYLGVLGRPCVRGLEEVEQRDLGLLLGLLLFLALLFSSAHQVRGWRAIELGCAPTGQGRAGCVNNSSSPLLEQFVRTEADVTAKTRVEKK